MTTAILRRAVSVACVSMALLLAGCAAVLSAAPVPAPTTPIAVAPSPTTTPIDTSAPESPLPDGCRGLLSAAGVTAVVGDVEPAEPAEHWHVAFETVGGVSCPFAGADVSGALLVVPGEVAIAAGLEKVDPDCAPAYGIVECVAAGVATDAAPDSATGQLWALVALEVAEDAAADGETQVARLHEAVVADLAGAAGRGVTSTAATIRLPLECAALGGRLDLTRVLGSDDVFPSRIEEGPGPLERRVAESLQVAGRCDWSELDDFREVGLIVYPDAAWTDPSELVDGDTTTIGGHPALVGEAADGRTVVVVSDGTNLLEIWSRQLDSQAVAQFADAVVRETRG